MAKPMTAGPRRVLMFVCMAALLSACGQATTNAPTVSTGPNSNREPQSPNSLPRGFETPNPLTSRTGIVGDTSVGR